MKLDQLPSAEILGWAQFSATLHLCDGKVFCKGIANAEGKRGEMHRHEADINPWLPSAVAPRLRWRTEVDGWLLLGFDRVAGRHADLSPGSPDLPLAANTVKPVTHELAHSPASAPRLAEQWARLAARRRLAKNIAPDFDPWARDHQWNVARGSPALAGGGFASGSSYKRTVCMMIGWL